MISDLTGLIWLYTNSIHFTNDCEDEKKLLIVVILIAVAGSISVMFNQLSFWLLTCKYWELSYELEQTILPIGYNPRPKWHRFI
jgi:hypothetical protein